MYAEHKSNVLTFLDSIPVTTLNLYLWGMISLSMRRSQIGSHAYGVAHSTSDMDFIVVLDDTLPEHPPPECVHLKVSSFTLLVQEYVEKWKYESFQVSGKKNYPKVTIDCTITAYEYNLVLYTRDVVRGPTNLNLLRSLLNYCENKFCGSYSFCPFPKTLFGRKK